MSTRGWYFLRPSGCTPRAPRWVSCKSLHQSFGISFFLRRGSLPGVHSSWAGVIMFAGPNILRHSGFTSFILYDRFRYVISFLPFASLILVMMKVISSTGSFSPPVMITCSRIHIRYICSTIRLLMVAFSTRPFRSCYIGSIIGA